MFNSRSYAAYLLNCWLLLAALSHDYCSRSNSRTTTPHYPVLFRGFPGPRAFPGLFSMCTNHWWPDWSVARLEFWTVHVPPSLLALVAANSRLVWYSGTYLPMQVVLECWPLNERCSESVWNCCSFVCSVFSRWLSSCDTFATFPKHFSCRIVRSSILYSANFFTSRGWCLSITCVVLFDFSQFLFDWTGLANNAEHRRAKNSVYLINWVFVRLCFELIGSLFWSWWFYKDKSAICIPFIPFRLNWFNKWTEFFFMGALSQWLSEGGLGGLSPPPLPLLPFEPRLNL